MPIDYSKFDSIDDSDEERGAGTSAALPVAQSGSAGRGRSGRPILEPVADPNQRFQILGSGGGTGGVASGGGGGSGPRSNSSPEELSAMEAEFAKLMAAGGMEGQVPQGEAEAKPGEPKRLCMRADGRKKIHTTFHDGAELVEEFDEKTDVLLLRKSRKPSKLGKEGEWVFEVGQPPEAAFDPHADLLRASTSNPIFMRKDTPDQFQWRIRNLAYPANVYSVTVDHEKQELVVRTSNKKYFKRIQVPDLARAGLKLQDELLTWKHQHNTLIISYTKPAEVLAAEQRSLQEAEKSALKI